MLDTAVVAAATTTQRAIDVLQGEVRQMTRLYGEPFAKNALSRRVNDLATMTYAPGVSRTKVLRAVVDLLGGD